MMAQQSPVKDLVRREGRAIACTALALLLAPGPTAASSDSADAPDSVASWILRTTEALAGAPDLAYQARFTIRGDEGRSETLQLRLRRSSSEKAIRTVVEAEDSSQGLRSVMRVDTLPNGTLKISSWDVDRRRWNHVAGALPTDRFLESDFHFEDLGFAFPIGKDSGSLARETLEGRERIHLESDAYRSYSRVDSWIDPSDFLPRKTEFRDLKQDLWRELLYEEFRSFQGRHYPTRIRVLDRQRSVESELQIERLQFGDGSREGDLELDSLERRIRAGLPALPELEWVKSAPTL